MEGNITKGAPKGKGQDLGMGPPPGIKLCKLFPPPSCSVPHPKCTRSRSCDMGNRHYLNFVCCKGNKIIVDKVDVDTNTGIFTQNID